MKRKKARILGRQRDWRLQKDRCLRGSFPFLEGSQTWKGSYTVEAAAVVSITIMVLAALILVSFYAHDRAVFQSFACEIAAVGSNYATEGERTSTINSAKSQVSASRFLGSSSLSGSVQAGEEEVTVRWDAVYPVPGFAAEYLAGGELSIDASWTSQILDPTDTIRLIRGAGKLITGGDD